MCLQPQSYLREAKPVCKHSFFHTRFKTPPHHKHPGLGSTFKVQKPKAAREAWEKLSIPYLDETFADVTGAEGFVAAGGQR